MALCGMVALKGLFDRQKARKKARKTISSLSPPTPTFRAKEWVIHTEKLTVMQMRVDEVVDERLMTVFSAFKYTVGQVELLC